MHLIERTEPARHWLAVRANRALDPIAFAAWDFTGWLTPRLRRLEDDELVLNLARAAVRRVRKFRRAMRALPSEMPS